MSSFSLPSSAFFPCFRLLHTLFTFLSLLLYIYSSSFVVRQFLFFHCLLHPSFLSSLLNFFFLLHSLTFLLFLYSSFIPCLFLHLILFFSFSFPFSFIPFLSLSLYSPVSFISSLVLHQFPTSFSLWAVFLKTWPAK